jgi:hypothetical protein
MNKPFGYFKAESWGWVDCAETDEGAIPLYEKFVLPDAITDNSESPEFRAGWNECREVMAGMMK